MASTTMSEESGATARAQEVAAQVQDKVQEKTQDVKEQASERARAQIDTRSTQIGEQVGSLVHALRKAAEQLEGDGNPTGAKAARQAATQADRLAGYLREGSADRFLGDVERFGRQRPWAAGGIGAALGFVASRFLKASSDRRYSSAQRSGSDADHPLSRDTRALEPPAAVSRSL